MIMNLDRYRNDRREASSELIAVTPLSPYFEDGSDPLFKVRGLTAAELGRSKEAAARQQDKAALVSALMGGNSQEKANALRNLSEGPEVPDDVAQRQEMLAIGCVEPKLQHSDAVLLSEDFPTEFYLLTNAILRLTGEGRQLGKSKASGIKK